jgi:CheY-like chemotaxis protein/anti-sigma regulatory factor (Ser/Thr protein kinase)
VEELASPLMPTRVLLVDDVDDVRLLLRTALRRNGNVEVVAEARDGAEALAAAVEHRPDVIVLDLGLPDLSASEIVQRLRERCDAKIIVFTGMDVGVGGGFTEQVEGFVRKDGDLRFLVDMLEALDVTSASTAALALRMDPAAAAMARAFVTERCLEWHCGPAIDAANLIVSELVTNAVLHGMSHPQLMLVHEGGSLRIEVADASAASPEPRVPDDDDEHGRGLLLVAAFSAAWGVQTTASGKRIWAQVPCRADALEPA